MECDLLDRNLPYRGQSTSTYDFFCALVLTKRTREAKFRARRILTLLTIVPDISHDSLAFSRHTR
jgi:hypothetical protein